MMSPPLMGSVLPLQRLKMSFDGLDWQDRQSMNLALCRLESRIRWEWETVPTLLVFEIIELAFRGREI